MSNHKSRKRVEKLFAGMQQLADSEPPNGNGHEEAHHLPIANTPVSAETPHTEPAALLEEMEALRARVRELEAQVNARESLKTAAPLIYEKEEIGFAYAGDQVMPIKGNQLSVQHETEVIKTQLTSGGKTIGEV